MKFNIILFFILFACFIGVFVTGYYLGGRNAINVPKDATLELHKFEKERDSLHAIIGASVAREQWLILKHEKDSALIVKKESSIALKESKLKTVQQRLDEIQKIVINHPDSFLIKRYPEQ